jgi:hypothetical protein
MEPLQENDEPDVTSVVIEVDKPILGYSRIEFTRHVLDRMEQRGITQGDVLRALAINKQVPGKQPSGRTRVCWDKSRKSSIHVVYKKGSATSTSSL